MNRLYIHSVFFLGCFQWISTTVTVIKIAFCVVHLLRQVDYTTGLYVHPYNPDVMVVWNKAKFSVQTE